MWIKLADYLDNINEDSEKYYEWSPNILKITKEHIPLKLSKLFPNNNSINKFEIGYGNGESIIKLALKNPTINYFGIDRKMKRVRKTLQKMNKKGNIENLIIARTDTIFLSDMFENDSFDEIIMNFPDPWPKKKHHKKRTLDSIFLKEQIYRLLKPKGIFRFSSDHQDYSFEVIEILKRSGLFENAYKPYDYKNHIPNRTFTQFEMHKMNAGLDIYHLKYRKI